MIGRVGVLGGTFDPIHVGHLILAEAARRLLDLERVVFVPAGNPWRKRSRPITLADHRLAMVSLAIADNPAFALSATEVEREGPSYTADTLAALHEEWPDAEGLYFIMGVDALKDLPNWKDPQRIIRSAYLAVATRPGWEQVNLAELERLIPGLLARLRPVDMPMIQISSSELRDLVARTQSIRYLVPSPVQEYIQRNSLYKLRE
jgi:nicotinate-nucleotide adenylyltransferase